MSEKTLDPIRQVALIETRPEHFLNVIRDGTVSTNIFLRWLHGFAVGMKWLPWPVLISRQWPRVKFKSRRGITWEEHQKLLARENDPERHAFLELLWYVGAAQIDLVSLTAENVDWSNRTICYSRRKTGKPAVLRLATRWRPSSGGYQVVACCFRTGRNSHRLNAPIVFTRVANRWAFPG
jgi:hypothetical protein